MLKVSFGDSDFRHSIQSACELFIENHIGKEARHQYGEEEFKALLDRVGLEAIRESIVVAAWGFYVASGAVWWDIVAKAYGKSPDILDIDRHRKILDYFNEQVRVELTTNFDSNGWNGETCYMDFFNSEVYLK